MEPKQKSKKKSKKQQKTEEVVAKEEPEVVQGEVTEATEGNYHYYKPLCLFI